MGCCACAVESVHERDEDVEVGGDGGGEQVVGWCVCSGGAVVTEPWARSSMSRVGVVWMMAVVPESPLVPRGELSHPLLVEGWRHGLELNLWVRRD